MQAAKPESPQSSLVVLLIDDQAIVGDAVRRMLASEADIQLHFCQDPAQAIPMALQLQPTIILQDLVMPGIDGMTLVQFFRSHPKLKQIPLVVLSSKEEALTKAQAFEKGASDYLVKLPDRIELLARIRHHSRGYIHLLERNEAFRKLEASQKELADQLAQAAEYVRGLLPKPMAEPALSTDWTFVPSLQLGGDCFGYHWIDSDHFALYLLDVCGHGVGPALLGVAALSALRRQTLPSVDFTQPGQVLEALNDAFPMEQHKNLFFTIWYGVYCPSRRQLSYSSGGHPPALLLGPDGTWTELQVRNICIGGMSGMRYKSAIQEIPPGSQLWVLSDGVFEVTIPDRDMWSWLEFRSCLEAGGAQLATADIHAHIAQLHGEPILEDDFSLMRVNFS